MTSVAESIAYRTWKQEVTGSIHGWFDPQLGQYSLQGLMIVIATGFIPLYPPSVYSFSEHEVLRMSFCDRAVSIVRRASSTSYIVYALETTFSVMKLLQNVCLDQLSAKFENGLYLLIN